MEKKNNRRIIKSKSFNDYVPKVDLENYQRVAHFLDWAAKTLPGRFVPYTWVARIAINSSYTPGSNSPEVEMVRKKVGVIKNYLWTMYNRRTVPAPRGQDLAIRATFDDDDLARTDYLRNKRRVHNGIARLEDTRSKIDTESMRDDSLRDMVLNMDPVLKKLTQPTLMTKLKALPQRVNSDDE